MVSSIIGWCTCGDGIYERYKVMCGLVVVTLTTLWVVWSVSPGLCLGLSRAVCVCASVRVMR